MRRALELQRVLLHEFASLHVHTMQHRLLSERRILRAVHAGVSSEPRLCAQQRRQLQCHGGYALQPVPAGLLYSGARLCSLPIHTVLHGYDVHQRYGQRVHELCAGLLSLGGDLRRMHAGCRLLEQRHRDVHVVK